MAYREASSDLLSIPDRVERGENQGTLWRIMGTDRNPIPRYVALAQEVGLAAGWAAAGPQVVNLERCLTWVENTPRARRRDASERRLPFVHRPLLWVSSRPADRDALADAPIGEAPPGSHHVTEEQSTEPVAQLNRTGQMADSPHHKSSAHLLRIRRAKANQVDPDRKLA
jgi:hypothetical protein